MSIFLKVDRFGSSPRLMRLRGLHAAVGEDRYGLLCCEAPAAPFFGIFCIDDRCLLRSERAGVMLNQRTLAAGQQAWIVSGDQIRTADYCFTLQTTSSAAEVLGACGAAPEMVSAAVDLQSLPVLVYQLANLGRSFPLLPGLELSVGSDPQSAVCIDLAGVAPTHLALTFRDGAVRLRAVGGKVAVNGREAEQAELRPPEARLTLLPAGLDLLVKPHP